MDRELLEICRKLRPLIGLRANRLWWYYYTAENPKFRQEGISMIRSLGGRLLGDQVSGPRIMIAPPRAYQLKGEFDFGKALLGSRTMNRVALRRSDLQKHAVVCGTTGSGKTNLVLHLLTQLLRSDIRFWAVDWKRSYRCLKRKSKNVRVFTIGRDVAPFEWNPLIPPRGVGFESWMGVIADVLERSHVSGQGVADIFLEHAKRLSEEGESSSVTFSDIRQSVERLRYPGRKGLWQQSCLRILRSLTYGEATFPTFNSRSSIRLESLLNQNVIFELDMGMPKNLRTFFMDVLIRWIHMYRLSEGESTRLRHVFVFEEAHNLLEYKYDSNSSLESVFRELRSFGQGAIAVTQHSSLLPIWMTGNVHILVTFSLSHQTDIESARRAHILSRDDESYFDLLKTGEAIAKIKGRASAIHVRFPKAAVKVGSVSDEDLRKNEKN